MWPADRFFQGFTFVKQEQSRQLPQAPPVCAPSGTLPVVHSKASTNRLLDVGQFRNERVPLSEEMSRLDELCGQVIQGGVYLVGGAPGGFKSGLALQVSLDLNRQGVRSLSILTEEPAHRLQGAGDPDDCTMAQSRRAAGAVAHSGRNGPVGH
jgi:predicted ATP-dependent serine protease